MDSTSSAKLEGQQPERDIVHAREGHVRRADHQAAPASLPKPPIMAGMIMKTP